jgi:hypothetical protein
MMAAARVSGLVTRLFDGRPALSMTSLMAVCSLPPLASYLVLARPAESEIEQRLAS